MKQSRRAFLGGAGGIVSLPLFDSLLPRKLWGQTAETPKRFIVYYVPNGRNQSTFVPPERGANFSFPKALEPLKEIKEYVTVLSGLKSNVVDKTVTCDHAKAAGPALTGMPILNGFKADLGISVDQYLVQALKLSTQFKSLQWSAAEPGVSDCGASNIYTQAISWANSTTPLGPLVTPISAFNQLFAGYDPKATEAQRSLRRTAQKSVLDFVVKDTGGLKAKMNPSDKIKLDEYLSGVREIETSLTKAQGNTCSSKVPDAPGRLDHEKTVLAFNELMRLAIQCDMTRVITFMLEYELSNRRYQIDGKTTNGHHSLSHYGSIDELNQLIAVERWETSMALDFAKKLKAMPEGNGNYLDNTTILFMPGMGQGANHNHDDIALAVIGKASGKINVGKHLRYDSKVELANLHVSVLRSMGVQVDKFGRDGNGLLEGYNA